MVRRAAATVAPLSAQPAPDDLQFWTLSASMDFKGKLSKYFFSNGITFFFSNSDRDFYSENNNVSQIYT
jgi:hypothetical protein